MITLVKWQTAKSITDGDNEYSYTYDENGIRTSKTVNGVTTYYNTSDGVILSQTDGTNTIYFQYDTNGTPLGFIYNGTQYLYMTNQMGDVIGLTKANGEVFAAYVYDEWGSLLSIQTIDSVSQEDLAAANSNPLRYRGYYYDTETGYYYLQSRYYDPSICRFISSDNIKMLLFSQSIFVGMNLFSYCNNSPTNNVDSQGAAAKKYHKVNLYTNKEFYNETRVILNNLKSYFNVNSSYTSVINSASSFQKSWNSSGNCSVAVINCHGNFGSINGLSRSSVLKLKKKSIKVLIILACHASELYVNKKSTKFSNIASAFAKVVSGGIVVASDGVVSSIPRVRPTSKIQHRFTSK